jgi:predicted transcriptional regulator
MKGRSVSDESENLIHLVADIVSAHVSNNNVAVGDVAALVQNVYAALLGLSSEPAATEAAKRQPAVTVRSSVKPDTIVCLICGTKNKMLKRHLQTAHGLTPAEYRAEFELKKDYPMVAPQYSEKRATLARSIGLGSKENRDKRAAAKPAPAKRGRPKKQPASEAQEA